MDTFGFANLGLTADDFTTPDTCVQLGYPPNRIDVITGIDGVTFEEAWATRVAAHLDGIPVAFICKDLLIRNKRASGRPKDIADVHNLGENLP